MTFPRQALLSFCTAIASMPVAHAHHSWTANYDLSQSARIYGTVLRVIFRSPHVALVVEVENEQGRFEQWTVEWGNPRGLRERGVDARTIKPGDKLLVSGNPHRETSTRSLHLQSLRRTSDGLRLSGRGSAL